MQKTEIFTKLIKGDLGDSLEQTLFAELSVDSTLRAEFRSFAAISAAIGENIRTFAPKPAQKAALFAKAGYLLPVISEHSHLPFYKGKLFIGMMSSIISVVITILLLYTIYDDFTLNNDLYKQSKLNHLAETNSSVERNLPPISYSVEGNNAAEKQDPEVVIKYVYIEKVSEQNQTALNTSCEIIEADYREDAKYITRDSDLNNLSNEPPANQYISINIAENSPFSLKLGNNNIVHSPRSTINPKEIHPFHNFGVGIYYSLSDELEIGMTVKQETYYLEYTGREENSVYKYSQQPNLTTFSLDARYAPYTFGNISPYIRLGAGANRGGFVFEPGLGVQYRFYANMFFDLNFYYGKYWFTHQDKIFDAAKYGLFYGLSYKF